MIFFQFLSRLLLLLLVFQAYLNADYTRTWTAQYGDTVLNESSTSVAVDSQNNIYLTGTTSGSIDTNTNVGGEDFFISKFSSDGTHQWSVQYGSTSDDQGESIAIDSEDNLYVSGYTDGDVSDDKNGNSGGEDIFIGKFSSVDGSKVWLKQEGTTEDDYGTYITVDSKDNIYIIGDTSGELRYQSNTGLEDIYIMKYSTSGAHQWTRLYGTENNDRGHKGVTDKNGNIYLTGYTKGDLDGSHSTNDTEDIILVKYDSNGNRQWTTQYGTDNADLGNSVTIDSDLNLYISGATTGDLAITNLGVADIFISKLSNTGSIIWSQQYGTTETESGDSIIADDSGNLFVTGSTQGKMTINGYDGFFNAFLTKFEDNSTRYWTEEFGTPDENATTISSLTIDSFNNIYLAGSATGDLNNSDNNGTHTDVILTQYEIQCPDGEGGDTRKGHYLQGTTNCTLSESKTFSIYLPDYNNGSDERLIQGTEGYDDTAILKDINLTLPTCTGEERLIQGTDNGGSCS